MESISSSAVHATVLTLLLVKFFMKNLLIFFPPPQCSEAQPLGRQARVYDTMKPLDCQVISAEKNMKNGGFQHFSVIRHRSLKKHTRNVHIMKTRPSFM
jgi:hypothetical protein